MTAFDFTKTYYKITNKEEIHYNYQYKDGLNVLDKKFQKEGSCVSGGLYFTDAKNLHNFYHYGVYVREITIPTDAQIVKDSSMNKYRCDKMILGKKTSLEECEYLVKIGLNNSRLKSIKIL